MFYAVPMTLLVPLFIYRARRFIPGRLRFHCGAVILGLALVMYSTAYNYTEVVRVVVLFYLTPIWGFLLARAFIGEAISPARWLAMVLGIGGALTIFGADMGLPLPKNLGDWLALGSGVLWAVGSLMLLTDDGDALDYGLAFFCWAVLIATAVAWFADGQQSPSWQWSTVEDVLPWMIPVAALVIIPSGFATIYGPTQLNPGTVGILFMAEIIVATATAAIFTGEPFGLRELLGVILIMLASMVELIPGRRWFGLSTPP
jgi:drug/metabolite transporter (DMT)-like permease